MTKPEVVCLCGSTRFIQEFQQANQDLTLEGKIVLSVGFFGHSQKEYGTRFVEMTDDIKTKLDALHLKKIDVSDRAHFLNVNGYIGSSAKKELAYAIAKGKRVSFLEPAAGEKFMEDNSHEMGRLVAKFTTNID